jgi:hypothetical protein
MMQTSRRARSDLEMQISEMLLRPTGAGRAVDSVS